jgi:integrase
MSERNVIEQGRKAGCYIFQEKYRDKKTGQQRNVATWTVRYDSFEKRIPGEKRKQVRKSGFPSALDALNWFNAQKAKPDIPLAKEDVLPTRRTCSQWFDEWLKIKSKACAYNTFRPYRSHVAQHIRPFFEQYFLDEVDDCLAAAFVDYLQTKEREDGRSGGLAVSNIHKIIDTVATICNDARKRKLIYENPFTHVDRPRCLRVDPEILPRDVWQGYIGALGDAGMEGVATILAIGTGCRLAEVLAIRDGQLDLKSNEPKLFVNQALERVKVEGPAGARYETRSKEPKTENSRRPIPLSFLVLNALRPYRAMLQEQRMADGRGRISPDTLLFADEDGNPIPPNTFASRYRRMLTRLGLPYYKFHALRATFGLILLEEGTPLDQVSRILGHSDVSTTARYYIGLSPRLQADAIAKLDRVAGLV